MTTVLLVVVGGILLVALHDVVRRPLLRRQALRNLARRPSETVIVIGGALLGTAIITASFVIGDTIDSSIRSIARTDYGPLDQGIVVDDPADLPVVLDAVTVPPIEGVDGVLTAVSTRGVIATPASDGQRRAEPSVLLRELDFDDARAFGGDPAATGYAGLGATPAPGEIVISRDVAATLDAAVGDSVEIFAYGSSRVVEVIAVSERHGLAGLGVENAHLAPGTLESWFASAGESRFDSPTGLVYVSNDGGVFDGADGSGQVLPVLHERTAALPGVEADDWKAELLADADAEGSELTTIFSSIGAFAVISGILLVINIVVMLTEERRTQLGILRALGIKRNQLVRVMGLEGTGYAVLATPIGVALGLGVGWVVGLLARSLVANDGLDLQFAFETQSLVTSALIGLLITLTTVWLASVRLARLNVIAAIRDLPAPPRRGAAWLRIGFGLVASVAGGALFALGATGDEAIPALVGVPIAAFGLVPLVSTLAGRRPAASAAAAASLVWGVGVFTILPDAMAAPDIDVFVFQGVTLTAAAVVLLTVNSSMWHRVLRVAGNGARSVPIRLGLTYPLAKPGRTGLLLGMYSLVIFTITFMAVIVAVFNSQGHELAAQAGGGHELIVDSSPANPPMNEDFVAIDGVEGAAALHRGWADIYDGRGWFTRPVTGIGPDLLVAGAPQLDSWSDDYATELDVWEAVLANDDLAIAGEFLIDDEGAEVIRVDSELTLADTGVGESTEVTIVGVLANDWVWNGVFMKRDAAAVITELTGPPTRHYLDLTPGSDPVAVAAVVNGELLTAGVDARSFEADIDEELAGQQGFIRILQGYLGLGLLIGVAGLGIVLVRAVRERRREIGMLRAMGYQSVTVRRAFLTEALFIAGQGALVGVALGLVSAWQVVARADVFGAGSPDLVIPVAIIAIIGLGPVAASLLAAIGPARRAAAIEPAVALRVTG